MTSSEIKQARQSLGLTRAEFAERLGLRNPQKVAKWEQGVYQISDEGAALIRLLLELNAQHEQHKLHEQHEPR